MLLGVLVGVGELDGEGEGEVLGWGEPGDWEVGSPLDWLGEGEPLGAGVPGDGAFVGEGWGGWLEGVLGWTEGAGEGSVLGDGEGVGVGCLALGSVGPEGGVMLGWGEVGAGLGVGWG